MPAAVPRFFVETPLRAGERVALPSGAAHHAMHVLRMQAGDALVLFDGRGGEYASRVATLERSALTAEVGEHDATEREALRAVTLLQGISSADRMDLTVQKAVELGVAAIQPLLTAKSVVRLAGARAQAKLEHWRRIVIAACEQCGRNRIPELRPARTPAEYCRAPDGVPLRLLLSPGAGLRLGEAAAQASGPLAIAAGPEAGFSADEEALLVGAGFRAVSLGPRVLRTETAALAALAALNALAGEF